MANDNNPSGIRMTTVRFTISDELMLDKIKRTYGLRNNTDAIRLGLVIAATGVLPRERVSIKTETIRAIIDLLAKDEESK